MLLFRNKNVDEYCFTGLTKCLETLSKSDSPGVFIGAWRALHNINQTSLKDKDNDKPNCECHVWSSNKEMNSGNIFYPDGVFPLFPPCEQVVCLFDNLIIIVVI